MWSISGLLLACLVSLLSEGVGAKICVQYRYLDSAKYINCPADCCGDWSYRYCCTSGTVNIHAVIGGLTVFGVMVIFFLTVCCRCRQRREQRANGNRGNTNDISTITQPAMFLEPPAYSAHDPYRGISNSGFHTDVDTELDYMKPPEYQKEPPVYERDPPTYISTVTNNDVDQSTDTCDTPEASHNGTDIDTHGESNEGYGGEIDGGTTNDPYDATTNDTNDGFGCGAQSGTNNDIYDGTANGTYASTDGGIGNGIGIY